jgi:apolipoprotein N-acyltransferase
MPSRLHRLVMHQHIFRWLMLVTLGLLSVPWIAMQATEEVNWQPADFAVMGILLFGCFSLFVVIARKVRAKYWTAIGIIIAVIFVYLWAELAVGVSTNLGS